MEKRGEISKEHVQNSAQLKRKGVRSFGPKKEENHYLKTRKPDLAALDSAERLLQEHCHPRSCDADGQVYM
jgi:hypothetical protein